MTKAELQDLFGDTETVAIERALAEIRSGRPVVTSGPEGPALTLAAESVDGEALKKLRAAGMTDLRLVLSPARLRLLGHDVATAGSIQIEGNDAEAMLNVVCQADARLEHAALRPASGTETAGLELVRLAYLLPAAVVVSIDGAPDLSGIASVDAKAIEHYREHVLTAPHIVSARPCH